MSELPRVTAVIKDAGLIDLSFVRPEVLERAGKFGTAAHRATELWDRRTLDLATLSAPLIPYLDAWKGFLSDYSIEIKPNEIERQFKSLKWGFMGSPDRWPIVKGKRTLIDIKTSTTISPVVGVQLAAYEILLSEAGIKIKQRWAVQLANTGYKVFPYADPLDRAAFIGALSLYNWKRRHP